MAIFLRLTGIAENAEITKECIGHLQGLADIMKVRNPGVLTYLFHASSDTQIDMYEVYTNSDSFIAHLQHEEAKVLLGKLASKLKISASVWCDGELSEQAKAELKDFGTTHFPISAGFALHPNADVHSNV